MPGAIGCTLSHLSVLSDAYTSGYKTIWVMEDDFRVDQDPYCLGDLIEELDALVGEDSWDVHYTDPDFLRVSDPDGDLLAQMPMKWRPDMPNFDLRPLLECTPVGEHFYKIGGRNRTHSLIVRRSGMKKILDFYRKHRMFLPLDHELSFIPDLKLYAINHFVIGLMETVSDTNIQHFHE
jgi:GR25 family glycosyltransferase involved in LPS biosynthesis